MIRLQRVTFLALHDYLGLTTELTRHKDEPPHPQPLHRTQSAQQRRHRMHTNSHSRTTKITTESPNHPEDEFIDNGVFQPIRSISTINESSPLSDQVPMMQTPDLTNTRKEPTTTSLAGRTIPTARQKKAAIGFFGQRSMSVVEGRAMKSDFEEAAARARVKNSLDTTFFEKHKISYPNVSNHRLSNSSTTKRRSSFSDVNLQCLSIYLFSF